jgi:hypothetical protein
MILDLLYAMIELFYLGNSYDLLLGVCDFVIIFLKACLGVNYDLFKLLFECLIIALDLLSI